MAIESSRTELARGDENKVNCWTLLPRGHKLHVLRSRFGPDLSSDPSFPTPFIRSMTFTAKYPLVAHVVSFFFETNDGMLKYNTIWVLLILLLSSSLLLLSLLTMYLAR